MTTHAQLRLAPHGTTYLGPIGTGATFEVIRVRVRATDLACKRLVPRARGEAAGNAAMIREAGLLGRAVHPSLPVLHGVGSDDEGPYLLESFVEGVSLRALVDGWRGLGQRMPAHLVRHVACAAATALAELHELADADGPLEASHGDLTPEHVLFGPLGEVRLIDFGAARFRDMPADLVTNDHGTVPFAAPEVVRGEAPPRALADVYALAATILSVALDEPLTDASGEAAMVLEIGENGLRRRLCDDAQSLTDAGREAIRSALARDPEGRLKSARALAEALACPP